VARTAAICHLLLKASRNQRADGANLELPMRTNAPVHRSISQTLDLFLHVAEAASITHGAARANIALASANEMWSGILTICLLTLDSCSN
jgi:hypothetical protein